MESERTTRIPLPHRRPQPRSSAKGGRACAHIDYACVGRSRPRSSCQPRHAAASALDFTLPTRTEGRSRMASFAACDSERSTGAERARRRIDQPVREAWRRRSIGATTKRSTATTTARMMSVSTPPRNPRLQNAATTTTTNATALTGAENAEGITTGLSMPRAAESSPRETTTSKTPMQRASPAKRSRSDQALARPDWPEERSPMASYAAWDSYDPTGSRPSSQPLWLRQEVLGRCRSRVGQLEAQVTSGGWRTGTQAWPFQWVMMFW